MASDESSALARWVNQRMHAMVARSESGNGGQHDEPQRRGIVISVCILASVLLWFSFAMQERYTRVLDVPTEIVNLQPDEALRALPPEKVRAQVEGEGIQLLRLYYNPPSIPVDASRSSVDLFTVAPEVVGNVRLESIQPRTLTLDKEDRLTRVIPIEARLSVSTDPGHHIVGGLRLSPDSLVISGARTLVEPILAWPTRQQRITGGRDSVSVSVALVDSLAGLVERSAERVTVSATIMEFTEGSRRIPVRVSGAPPGQRVTLDPATVQVIYQVPLQQFDVALRSDDFYASVPYEVIRRDTTGSVLPIVRVPDGLVFREVRTSPAALRYYFYVLDQ